mmetsp:Transcript_16231/g.30700  ORF Transcript_16231/g.30700 Transcript_16231/m.30700 type:complete len:547 (+) Transcript_16231:228-1868(+)
MASATSFVPPEDHDSFDNLEEGKLFEDQTLTTSAIQPAGFRENHTAHNATRAQTGDAGGGQKESSEKESLLLTIQSEQNTNDPCTNSHEQNDKHPKRQPLDKWPDPLDDESALERNLLQPLQRDVGQAKNTVEENGTITVRSITWNQHAQDFPSIQTLREQLLLPSYFHLVVVGTQECENTIAKSLLYPSKVNWEKHCLDALGFDYELVRGHSLQASHLALYAHRSIVHLLSEVDSTAVATGLCDKLGNKGGIAIKIKIGTTKFCFLTAHLSAYQHQMSKRTFEFLKISKEVSRAFGHVAIESSTEEGMMDDSTSSASYYEEQRPKLVVASVNKKVDLFEDNCLDKENPRLRRADTSTTLACSFCSTCSRSIRQCRVCCNPGRIKNDKYNPLLDAFDHVIWCGDFNFRIHGTRDIVDTLLKKNRCDVLLHNDQLTMLMQYDKAFKGFKEGPVTFRPTYKFDKLSDKYDTSSKRRIPAWTDRIIFKENSRIELLSYCSARNLRISDHRPVYASFRCFFDLDDTENRKELQSKELMRSESRSEVCVIS